MKKLFPTSRVFLVLFVCFSIRDLMPCFRATSGILIGTESAGWLSNSISIDFQASEEESGLPQTIPPGRTRSMPPNEMEEARNSHAHMTLPVDIQRVN
jgi:hypothetical protein